jgi:hypothetical protein
MKKTEKTVRKKINKIPKEKKKGGGVAKVY